MTLPNPGLAHEFEEDIADCSMCLCGIPALYHDAAMRRLTCEHGRTNVISRPLSGERYEICALCGLVLEGNPFSPGIPIGGAV